MIKATEEVVTTQLERRETFKCLTVQLSNVHSKCDNDLNQLKTTNTYFRMFI